MELLTASESSHLVDCVIEACHLSISLVLPKNGFSVARSVAALPLSEQSHLTLQQTIYDEPLR